MTSQLATPHVTLDELITKKWIHAAFRTEAEMQNQFRRRKKRSFGRSRKQIILENKVRVAYSTQAPHSTELNTV